VSTPPPRGPGRRRQSGRPRWPFHDHGILSVARAERIPWSWRNRFGAPWGVPVRWGRPSGRREASP